VAELATGVSDDLEAVGQELVTEETEEGGEGLLLCEVAWVCQRRGRASAGGAGGGYQKRLAR